MPQFRYRAVTQAGELVAGEVEAPSREEVIRRIEYLGHLPVEAEPAAAGVLDRLGAGVRAKAPRPREATQFLRELAILLGAGLTLEDALKALGEDTSKTLTRFAGALRASISAGDGFGEALARHPAVIRPAHLAMVRAGEASGRLESVLGAIVEDRTRTERLAERFNSALRYPVFLIGAAILVMLFFLICVVPQFQPVFKDLGGRLNAGAAFVLALSNWLQANYDLMLGACLALLLGAWMLLRRAGMRARLIAAVSALPGIAGPMRDRRTARLVGSLGLLVRSGVELPTALKLLRDMVVEPRAVAALERVHEQLRAGRRFADALAETDLLPPLAVRMLRIGDETGDLPTVAMHASQFYEHKLNIGLERLIGAIGPITIILVSVVIGSLIVSIMSALLSITELAF